MTQNDIEKRLNAIEKSIDKMSANYDRTLNEIMVEQEKQKTCKVATDAFYSVTEKEQKKKKDLLCDKLISFSCKAGIIFIGLFITAGIIYSILTAFIPTI